MGIDPENTIKIWLWSQGKLLATVSGHSERIFDICFHAERVISCGVKHIRFWTLLGNTLQFEEGLFGRSEAQTLLCLGTFPPLATNDDAGGGQLCFTGAINGDLIIWKKTKIDRIISGAHRVRSLMKFTHSRPSLSRSLFSQRSIRSISIRMDFSPVAKMGSSKNGRETSRRPRDPFEFHR